MRFNNGNREFGLIDKIAYLCGDLANDLTFIMAAFFLMLFYTNVLEIPGYVVGLLFLSARVIDAFTDIGMGRLLDTSKAGKDGRFRTWIKRASPFVCITGFLMFVYVVKDWAYPLKLAYVVVTYILWGSFSYTAVNIPYGSMATVISAKPEDRAALSGFRAIGANIAILLITSIVPLLIYKEIDGKQVIQPEMFTVIMAVFTILAFILYQICYRFTIERIKLPDTERQHSKQSCVKDVTSIFSGIKSNRPLQIFILVAIILLLSSLSTGTLNPYLYIDYFNNKLGLSIGGIIPVACTFAMVPFAPMLVKRFGKKESAAVGMLITSVIYFALFILRVENLWAYLVLITIAALTFNYFMIIIWAFIADIIDNQYLKSNVREDGTIYSVYSFARKLGQALAGGLGGFVLSFVGYTANVPKQSPETLEHIYNVATLIPAISALLIFIILQYWYPLSKSMVEKNMSELAMRTLQPNQNNQ
ncbi:MFS transporter [Lonepinella koalarum]|uniref:GPH family glycoside/pentoside/hexuronide:cation symporter n=1 Tax=Lonepinella koalarum TaxID=53417 RepID=A0A4R1KQ98_9PAST|nr:glycoside-pentoside-hexuronide (GPH):cation symporter [Lonepinella koalarum]MDH2925618.1 MFS transporter [Lonepinella koalarum]TCK67188.1 GPH family glycoside/pentoside/hexuronide:cation symporter [Lonepinella koalarum]TFJ89154.1 MFS transporter [Lonepinella koalarum]TYG35020.1 MFS transporter [Lonepinella koalarum]